MDAELVAAAHTANLQLITYTVDRPGDIVRLAALGVDGICTNTPDVARKALG